MAVLTGTISSIHNFSTVVGNRTDGSGNSVMCCLLAATFSGTYAQADNAQLTLVPTAIKDSMRLESTVTLLSAAFAQRGLESTTPIGAGPLCTVSGTSITFQLTGSDLTTEHASAALGTMNEPIWFFVSFTTSTP